MIRRAKGLELMKPFYIINLSTFSSKMFLTLKIMDFEIFTYLINFGLHKSPEIPTHILIYSNNETVI